MSEEASKEKNELPSMNTGREKRLNTQNPLWAGGKVKLPPGGEEYSPLGKEEGATGDPRISRNQAQCATHRSLWSEEIRRIPCSYKGRSREMSCCFASLLCPHTKQLGEFFLTGSKQCGKGKTAQPKAQSRPELCLWKCKMQSPPEQNPCL